MAAYRTPSHTLHPARIINSQKQNNKERNPMIDTIVFTALIEAILVIYNELMKL